MKIKIIVATFMAAFLGSTAFAASAPNKRAIPKVNINDLKARTLLLEKQVRSLQGQLDNVQTSDRYAAQNLDLLVEMAHGPAIVASPALGVRRSAEDGSDLMVNLSSINEDLKLLQLRQKMDNYAVKNNISIPDRPIIALSGSLEGQMSNTQIQGETGKFDINLRRAELDVVGEASPWATAAMIISYDDKAQTIKEETEHSKYVRRTDHSRLRVDRAFITIGQLNKFPLYFTVGQIFAPFGNYSSNMINDPLTKAIGRFKDRMAVVGFYWKGLSGQIYGYPGEARVLNNNDVLRHAGANLDYQYEQGKFKVSVGGGVIGNIAESDGMQTKVFEGYFALNNELHHTVPGISGHVKTSYDMFNLMGSYVGATKKFDNRDLAFDAGGATAKENSEGAKPQAVNVEGSVEFKIKGKPNTFSLGYGRSWQAVGLGLDKHTFAAGYGVSLIKNTILSFEFRHSIGYRIDERGNEISTGKMVGGSGKSSNSGTVRLGVYF